MQGLKNYFPSGDDMNMVFDDGSVERDPDMIYQYRRILVINELEPKLDTGLYDAEN